MNVLEWKVFYFDENLYGFVLKDQIKDKPALVQIMAWHQRGYKPLYESMLAYFTDSYMGHSAAMS